MRCSSSDVQHDHGAAGTAPRASAVQRLRLMFMISWRRGTHKKSETWRGRTAHSAHYSCLYAQWSRGCGKATAGITQPAPPSSTEAAPRAPFSSFDASRDRRLVTGRDRLGRGRHAGYPRYQYHVQNVQGQSMNPWKKLTRIAFRRRESQPRSRASCAHGFLNSAELLLQRREVGAHLLGKCVHPLLQRRDLFLEHARADLRGANSRGERERERERDSQDAMPEPSGRETAGRAHLFETHGFSFHSLVDCPGLLSQLAEVAVR